jgi:hypothetical protein
MAEFRKQNALQTGFIMKTKFKMSISSLQPLLVYGLINCGLAFTFSPESKSQCQKRPGAFEHLFRNVDGRACSFLFFLPLLRHNQTREGDTMQWVSERGFYLIYTMLNILSAIALENGRGNSNKMHRITLGNFMSFVTWFNQLKVKFGNFYNLTGVFF